MMRNFACFQSLQDKFRVLGAGGRDLFQIFRVRVAFFLLLGDGDGDVAAVLDDVAEGFETSFKAGDAHCRRAHVYAAA